VLLFIGIIKRIAFDLGDIVSEGIIPRLIEEFRSFSETSKEKGHGNSREGSESRKRSDRSSCTGCDTARTWAREGSAVTAETGCSVATADTAPIVLGGRAC
jgi:hypothetical protein